MKRILYLLSLLCIITLSAASQTVDDIMNGIVVKKGEKIILKLDKGNNLLYDVSNAGNGGGNSLDLIKYDDKRYFLIRKDAVNIYMFPINPLNISVNSEVSDRLDLISSASDAAINAIANQITAMKTIPDISKQSLGFSAYMTKVFTLQGAQKPAATTPEVVLPNCSDQFKGFITKSDKIATMLKNNQKTEIAAAFGKLKGLTFEDEDVTKKALENIKKDIDVITQHFAGLKTDIAGLQDELDKFDCNDAALKYLFKQAGTNTLKNIQAEMADQTKRLDVLQGIYDLVNNAYTAAAGSKGNMISWLVNLGSVSAEKGKIVDFSIKITKSGYELTTNKEIQASKSESVNTYTISVRKFDWFVPQVAAGIVYANVDYPKFGTATNAAGKTVVADGGSDKVTKFSVTTMVNFNMFIPNSSICPFVQVGVGANSDYPALFFGGGLKISNVLSISAGAASPWIKQLNKLKIDSEISGTADLEKDITREFKPFSKVYCGLQIKL